MKKYGFRAFFYELQNSDVYYVYNNCNLCRKHRKHSEERR